MMKLYVLKLIITDSVIEEEHRKRFIKNSCANKVHELSNGDYMFLIDDELVDWFEYQLRHTIFIMSYDTQRLFSSLVVDKCTVDDNFEYNGGHFEIVCDHENKKVLFKQS